MMKLNLQIILCFLSIWILTQNAVSQTATIDLSDQKQIIRGFGASNAILWRPDMTESEVEAAFGTDDGQIGFSILRIMLEADESRWSLYVSTCKKAQDLGAKIIASAWYAPDDLVETVDGELRLKDDKYDEYAEHINDFISYMNNNGVTVYGVSVQNEPDIGEWTQWTTDEMLTFMRDYANLIEGAKVMAPESYHFDRSYSDPILNNTTATANTDIICGHIYGGGLSSYSLAEEKGKEIWMTEYLTGWEHSANTWQYAFEVAEQIHDVMQVGWNAYVWWNIVRYYGPIADGEKYDENADEDYSDKGEVTKKGYVMSQYTKFVRPGYYRVEATENPSTNIHLTAFKKDESVVIVVINQNSSSNNITLSLQNGSVSSYTKYTTSTSKNVQNDGVIDVTNGTCTVSLDASSVTTFVSSGTGTVGSEYVWLEAECGEVGSLWETLSDDDASNGEYVAIQSGNESLDNAPSSTSGQISYSFDVSQGGSYSVWSRVITPNGNDDSFWIKMDDGSWTMWNSIGPNSSWAWEQANSYTLSSGSHTFTVGYREDGALLDKILITNSGDTPSGEGSSATNCSSEYNISVRALGEQGDEQITLSVGGTEVQTWTLGTSLGTYTATTSLSGKIRVEFINDNGDRDVQVDYIVVGGSTKQAEDQATNTGVWQDSSCGGEYSEWLNCNGYIEFDSFKNAGSQSNGIQTASVKEDMGVYPNPAKETLHIALPQTNNKESIVHIYNSNGKLVLDTQLTNGEKDISLLGLPSGIYIVSVNTGGNIQTQKFLKQ